MLVEKEIVVKWNHESILNIFRIHGKGKTVKVLLFEFIGRWWRGNIRFTTVDQINFKNNVRDAVDDVYAYGGAVDTDSAYTCSNDYLDDNDDNSDDDGRDDHVLNNNDDPIEKNEANSDFQRKIDALKPNGCTWVKN